MAKNNYFINQVKEIERLKMQLKEGITTHTAHIYACFCKVLFDSYGWDAEQIAELFSLTDRLWDENLERMDSMIDWCEETTGIEIRSREE